MATFEKENDFFVVRVTGFRRATYFGGALAGADYVFETRTKSESDWREIMVFPHDVEIAIDEEIMQFVDDRVAYVFMGWMYAVTTDGGATWTVWDGMKCRFENRRIGFNAIESVELSENGTGLMKLNLIGKDQPILLRTKNFGVDWIMEATN